MIATPSNSILLRHFREFYSEVVRRRAALTRTLPRPALAGPAEAGGSDPGNATWHVLYSLLQAQADETARRGGMFGARVYQEVQYVLAALADEIFLHSEWEGRATWPLLEAALFHTHSAGETIFERIDALLARPDYAYADLAAVYFWALSLGFEGKYRDSPDHEALAKYRRQLFEILYRDRPRLTDAERPLFPDCYLHNLEEGSGRRLPTPRLWLGLLAAVLLLWVGAAQIAWTQVSGRLSQAVCQIDRNAGGCPAMTP